MSKAAADQARARASRCSCGHRRDAHASRSDGGPVIAWCRNCNDQYRFTAAEPSPSSTPATCPYLGKKAHPNRGASEKAAEAFECRAGHWHVGRPSTRHRRP